MRISIGILGLTFIIFISFMIRLTFEVNSNLDKVEALVREANSTRLNKWNTILNIPFSN